MGGQDDLLRTAHDLVSAFNDADWERLRETLAEYVVYVEAGTGRRVYGIEPYVQLCQGWRRALPDATATIDRAVGGADTVAQSITWTGTHTGPLDGPASTLPASGRQINVAASLWCTFEDGKVTEVHHHLDLLSLLQQIGALAPPTAVGALEPSRGVADQPQKREEKGVALR
jgi:steroid delta-isomerase-like uncharacterized protein